MATLHSNINVVMALHLNRNLQCLMMRM